MKCYICDGSGKVGIPYMVTHDDTDVDLETCVDCEGTGEVFYCKSHGPWNPDDYYGPEKEHCPLCLKETYYDDRGD